MQKKTPYLLIAFGVAFLICLLSFFDLYDNFENSLLDMRFKNRGLVEVRNDIATVDIDTDALATIGKWSPWSRDKHLPVINVADEHGMDAFLFDFYFIEDSERELNIKDIDFHEDSIVTVEQIKDKFPDPDNDLAAAAEKAGNIIFAQSFKPKTRAQAADSVKKRTAVMDRRLSLLKEKNYFRKVSKKDSVKYATIFSAYDIEAPIDVLIEKSDGIYFFQSDPDPDGVQRRFPLLILYGNRLFPAASLAMALKHYKVSFDSVVIEPGKYLRFDLPEPDEHGRTEIHIPINKKGQMVVNWAGPWKDKETGKFDMMHYPYTVIKDFQENERLNSLLAKSKKEAFSDTSLLSDIQKRSVKIFKNSVRNGIPKGQAQLLYFAGIMEKYINNNPDKSALDWFASIKRPAKAAMVHQFNEIKNNNLIADQFIKNGSIKLDQLLNNSTISLDVGINDYKFSSYMKLESDINKAISITKDPNKKTALKKAITDYTLLERNFQIISNLYQNGLINEQRPLIFYVDPKAERLLAGKEVKGNARLIVPFEFVGKKLYYGLTAAGTSDLNPMPFDSRYPMVGLHANALNTILDNRIIFEIPKGWVAFIILGLGVLLAFGVPSLSPAMGGLATAIIVGGYTWLSFWLFSNQFVWLDMVGPLSTMAVGYLGITVYNYIQEEKNKQFLKESFGTYVSPELIDQMYDSGEEPSLGGEEGYHTAFFTDIQSFSAFSEKLSATDLVSLLNEYLTDMTNVLLENKGTLDKYIGDAIVAFYGAPIEIENHELWACRTAIIMQENLEVLRQNWQSEGERWPEIVHHMQNRIGINTGQMVTGNMGSESRMNYTMMGDTVNLAARLEASAKQYGIYIQIADTTYQPVKDQVVVRDLDFVRVMGKTEPAQVYELISETGKEPELYKKLLPAFHEALALYRNQNWSKTIEAFKASDDLEDMFPGRKTNPSRIYIPRCEHYMDNPPGDDWDGAWTLTSK